MRPALITILCFVTSGVAYAQPKPMRRPGTSRPAPGRTPAPTKTTDRPDVQPTNICPSRQAVLNTERGQLDEKRSELSGVEAELRELARQTARLRQRQLELTRQVARKELNVETRTAIYKKECQASENCTQYDSMAAQLATQSKPIEDELDRVRTSISAKNREVSDLRRRIDPLRREYQQKRCNNLVPGQTAQATIDRCTYIFSEWNRMQATVNGYDREIASLKSQYERLLAALMATERRATDFATYMKRNCRSSKQIAGLNRYQQVRGRAQQMGKDLDRLIQDINKIRAVQLSVQ